jgi:hypothetical protein
MAFSSPNPPTNDLLSADVQVSDTPAKLYPPMIAKARKQRNANRPPKLANPPNNSIHHNMSPCRNMVQAMSTLARARQ